MARIYVFMVFLLLQDKVGPAQCKATWPITNSSLGLMTDVFQLTFLHYPLQNKLDSLVFQLNYPVYVTDSAYYNWPAHKQQRKSLLDIFQYQKVINDIGQLQTDEAFCLLTLPYVYEDNQSMYANPMIDDLSPFHSLLSVIKENGGRALNTYFLHNRVPSSIANPPKEQEVWRLAKQLWPKRVEHLKLCERLDPEAYSMALMRTINPRECDSAVLAVINTYINKNSKVKDNYSLDSIMIGLHQLPHFLDGIADDCVVKESIHDHRSVETKIGVIYKMPPFYPWENYTAIERVYTIISQPEHGQTITNIEYGNQFVTKTRLTCKDE